MRMILTSVADFFLVAGSTVTGAMLQQGQVVMPGKGVWILAGITGFVALWSHVKASLSEAPQ
jgi:hypothetical protein